MPVAGGQLAVGRVHSGGGAVRAAEAFFVKIFCWGWSENGGRAVPISMLRITLKK